MSIQTSTASAEKSREFVFTDRDFRAVAALVHERAGIALSEAKRELVYSRLARRLRALGLRKFSDYLRLVRDEEQGPAEMGNLINAITTNLTAFFREGHHFDHLRSQVVEPLAAASGSRKSLLVWCAGCSTGEEPYSTAMTIASAMPNWSAHDIRILATDLDTNAVAAARRGRYRAESAGSVPAAMRQAFLRPAPGGEVEVVPALRPMLAFKQLNLRGAWPMRRQYDVIFCRNVMIYFDDDFKRQLLEGFHRRLKPGGHLYIGHSESATKLHDGFRLVGRTIYERLS